jgi:hypothetical protein
MYIILCKHVYLIFQTKWIKLLLKTSIFGGQNKPQTLQQAKWELTDSSTEILNKHLLCLCAYYQAL